MNQFEKDIQMQNELQKAQVDTVLGNNGLNDIIKGFQEDGLSQEEMLEKAKYIRREGSKGNYKYIYDEPKENKIKVEIKDISTPSKMSDETLKEKYKEVIKHRDSGAMKNMSNTYKTMAVDILINSRDYIENLSLKTFHYE